MYFSFSDFVSVMGALGALWLVWGHCGPLQWLFLYLGWGLTSTHWSARGPLSTILLQHSCELAGQSSSIRGLTL